MYFRPFIETPFHPVYNDCFGSHLVLYSSWSYDHSGGMIIQIENKIGRLHQKLVGGFNPFEKYARQNGWKKIWNHHPENHWKPSLPFQCLSDTVVTAMREVVVTMAAVGPRRVPVATRMKGWSKVGPYQL